MIILDTAVPGTTWAASHRKRLRDEVSLTSVITHAEQPLDRSTPEAIVKHADYYPSSQGLHPCCPGHVTAPKLYGKFTKGLLNNTEECKVIQVLPLAKGWKMSGQKKPESTSQAFEDYEIRNVKAEVLTLRSEMAALTAEVTKVNKNVKEIKEVLERLSTNTMLMISAVLKLSQAAITHGQKGEGQSGTTSAQERGENGGRSPQKVTVPVSETLLGLGVVTKDVVPSATTAESISGLWQVHSVKTLPNPAQIAHEETPVTLVDQQQGLPTLPSSSADSPSTLPAGPVVRPLANATTFPPLQVADGGGTLPQPGLAAVVPQPQANGGDCEEGELYQFSSDKIETALSCCKRKKNSRRNYATHLLRLSVPESDRRLSNCAGVRGQQPIDKSVLNAIKKEVFSAFPVLGNSPVDVHAAWRECIVAMDESCRRLRRSGLKP